MSATMKLQVEDTHMQFTASDGDGVLPYVRIDLNVRGAKESFCVPVGDLIKLLEEAK